VHAVRASQNTRRAQTTRRHQRLRRKVRERDDAQRWGANFGALSLSLCGPPLRRPCSVHPHARRDGRSSIATSRSYSTRVSRTRGSGDAVPRARLRAGANEGQPEPPPPPLAPPLAPVPPQQQHLVAPAHPPPQHQHQHTHTHTARHHRTNKQLSGTPERPRLAVFRTNEHIYAQVIDDVAGRTLAAASTLQAEVKAALAAAAGGAEEGSSSSTRSVAAAEAVGKKIAEACAAKGISAVAYDRGGFAYHGRVQALADAAREGGLKF